MAIEIERKFLVINDNWKTQGAASVFKQAYLNSQPERTVRIRVADQLGYITIKSKTYGISRQEFEYNIPVDEAEQLLLLCETPALEKIRHRIKHDNHIWEVDEFTGLNSGLVVAEIELGDENEVFDKPNWLGEEVSNNIHYYNSYLSKKPYTTWNS